MARHNVYLSKIMEIRLNQLLEKMNKDAYVKLNVSSLFRYLINYKLNQILTNKKEYK